MDQEKYKVFVSQVRSQRETDKLEALSQIPYLISLSLQQHVNPGNRNGTLVISNSGSNLNDAGENNDNSANQIDDPTVYHLLDQILLLIYNLNSPDDEEKFKKLKANNRIFIIRHLLRLYLKSVKLHSYKQLKSLHELITLSHHSPELLVELAHVIHGCSKNLTDPDNTKPLIDEALDKILYCARVGLYPDALLMIHSIYAIRERENQKQESIPTT